jgi:hypothetical protein
MIGTVLPVDSGYSHINSGFSPWAFYAPTLDLTVCVGKGELDPRDLKLGVQERYDHGPPVLNKCVPLRLECTSHLIDGLRLVSSIQLAGNTPGNPTLLKKTKRDTTYASHILKYK